MATGISVSMVTAPFKESLAEMDKQERRATMYALRATGRSTQRAAKSVAPVYHGTDPRAMAESGNLKKSIRNSKRLIYAGGKYALKTGPFGTKTAGTLVVRHGTRGGFAIDSLTAKHLGIEGPSVKKGESTKGQVRGVLLYRSVQELNYGYMGTGVFAGAGSVMQGIFEDAYAKAFAKAKA
jgi:hypothetical protein